MMYRTGALIVSSNALLLPALAAAARLVTGVLYVPLTQTSTKAKPNGHSNLLEATQQIRQVYFHISKWSPLLDVRILLPHPTNHMTQLQPSRPLQHNIDVLLSPMATFHDVKESVEYQVLSTRVKSDLEHKFQNIPIDSDPMSKLDFNQSVQDLPCLKTYSDIALGGTFDNIHNGHRLLLTESALVANSRILVGIANGPLLESKVLPELIKPVEERISNVRAYLSDLKPSIKHDIVAITDVYGPTAWDDRLEGLVVSPETSRGGEKINTERQRKGLNTLAIHVIGLVGTTGGKQESSPSEKKLSSSDIRKNTLGSYRPVHGSSCLATYDPSKGPYLVGLTGGIASGKSSVFNRLVKMGAYPIDCDKLGHLTYRPGMPAYSKIIEAFGEGILSENGEVNRKVLGPIVFSDKAKLQRLNEIVWPEIWKLVEEMIHQAHQERSGVCVIDAAVMLKAGWDKNCHEIWVTIAPENEVVRRVMERDNLTEEAAQRRMSAQMTNREYVSQANVVFSTQWEPEYTQKQVEKAWTELRHRLTAPAQSF